MLLIALSCNHNGSTKLSFQDCFLAHAYCLTKICSDNVNNLEFTFYKYRYQPWAELRKNGHLASAHLPVTCQDRGETHSWAGANAGLAACLPPGVPSEPCWSCLWPGSKGRIGNPTSFPPVTIHPQTWLSDIQPTPRQALPSPEPSPGEAVHQLGVTRVPGKQSVTAMFILLVNLGLSWEIIEASYSPVILRLLLF